MQLGHLEIDIIARKGECVYFIEVKYRSQSVSIEYVLSKYKKHKFLLAVKRYLWKNKMKLACIKLMLCILTGPGSVKWIPFDDLI